MQQIKKKFPTHLDPPLLLVLLLQLLQLRHLPLVPGQVQQSLVAHPGRQVVVCVVLCRAGEGVNVGGPVAVVALELLLGVAVAGVDAVGTGGGRLVLGRDEK